MDTFGAYRASHYSTVGFVLIGVCDCGSCCDGLGMLALFWVVWIDGVTCVAGVTVSILDVVCTARRVNLTTETGLGIRVVSNCADFAFGGQWVIFPAVYVNFDCVCG